MTGIQNQIGVLFLTLLYATFSTGQGVLEICKWSSLPRKQEEKERGEEMKCSPYYQLSTLHQCLMVNFLLNSFQFPLRDQFT